MAGMTVLIVACRERERDREAEKVGGRARERGSKDISVKSGILGRGVHYKRLAKGDEALALWWELHYHNTFIYFI